jgi:membrane-bound metal-dependent hydrolase YbcI (DUF457 family)
MPNGVNMVYKIKFTSHFKGFCPYYYDILGFFLKRIAATLFPSASRNFELTDGKIFVYLESVEGTA